jgi:uncharacterized protein YjlB
MPLTRGLARMRAQHHRHDEHRREAGASAHDIDAFILQPNGWVPNNSRLPVIVYRHAFDADAPKLVEQIETRFAHHAWPVQWRNGVFDFHHFHSTAHEVLGVFAGAAEVILGGPGGRTVRLAAGDVLLLPAGTGHCLLSRTDAFQVAGGYPAGQQWDIRRDALTSDELRAMAALPFPASDPVYGTSGPVIERWVSQA